MMKDFEKKAKAYALKNALSHGGSAKVGSVISSLFNEGLKKEEVKKYSKRISEIVSETNALSIEEQQKEFEELKELVSERETREGLPELPNVGKNGIVTRFSPSPSGGLHIGHALTASISYLFFKKYGGKFYVRIEDTNPENIYPDAYELIKEDSDWLFESQEKIVIQSERMEIYYSYIEKLLEKERVYVCTCDSESFRDYVKNKEECPCRNNDLEENKRRWKKMLDNSGNGYKEGEAVLRFKSDMRHKNPAMRDFPLARINDSRHYLQGYKYRVWPLMNLAVSVDDIEMGITHIIRAKEHRDNGERQKMIYSALGLEKKYPWTSYLGRIHFKDMELSSTKITEGIKNGIYSGWDDPRLPTVSALRKKGYRPEAFWKFAEKIGLRENDKVMDKNEFFTLLDNFNKTKE